jgi:transposase-like protein
LSIALGRGDKWYLDEVAVTINGNSRWLWHAVDQHGRVYSVATLQHVNSLIIRSKSGVFQ